MRHVLLALVVAAAARAGAQQPTSPADADSSRLAIMAMTTALRHLVVAQEKHWAKRGSYTTDMADLGFYPPAKDAPRAPMPQVIVAGSRGWTGIIVDRRVRKSCVIYVGIASELPGLPRTQYDQLVAADEGVPRCEMP